jgi:hypothetical protein
LFLRPSARREFATGLASCFDVLGLGCLTCLDLLPQLLSVKDALGRRTPRLAQRRVVGSLLDRFVEPVALYTTDLTVTEAYRWF